ncbi:type II toxin-antitoxin system ParD family antitoxin [Pararhizobium gei]|uniref:type II toxin-antitoxin system ParD family antitoxin n=1 Tax=Pararhizobium gei TaxID=1395951 RepID=UPI0023DB52C3|nr:type II toxin-antitoxin system ParD family antitoxin [Rhizobium gei]
MRTSKPITITLGQQQASLDARLQSGSYASASEVLRAGLRALDREDAALDEIMRLKIREAINDPQPDIPASEVFERLRARHNNTLKAGKRDA